MSRNPFAALYWTLLLTTNICCLLFMVALKAPLWMVSFPLVGLIASVIKILETTR